MKPNLPIAFASLLLSLMLWFVVFAQNLPEPSTLNAPIAIDGLDDGRFFIRKAPTDVRLAFSGPAERIKTMREERVTASVDLSQPEPGTHNYPVSLSPAWVGKYLLGPRPTASVQIERIASRSVPVTSVVKGTLRDPNLQIIEKHLSPQRVTVRGPESEVSAIDEVRAYLDLSSIDPSRPDPQEAELVPLDGRGGRPQHVRTIPSVVVNYFSIGASPSTKLAQVVPDLDVTYDPSVLPDGYRLKPDTVSLAGKPAVLANVSKVPTETVHARRITGTSTFKVRLLAPGGTSVVGSTLVEVTVLVRPAPVLRSGEAPAASGTVSPPASTPTPQ